MEEPEFTQHPTELFGYPFTNLSSEAQTARNNQYCPFLDGECKKPRKSQPDVKVGTCTVGYKGNFLKKMTPVIICPHRLEVPVVYDTIAELYFGILSDDYQVGWASEVSCGVAGSIDFVAAKMKRGIIGDFICVELQAAGTTGTPWAGVEDFKQIGHFKQSRYNYGINWANEFLKTMMQQAYKKGMVVEKWNKKIVFVIQDVGLSYIQSTTDASDLRDATDEDAIHFCTFRTVWAEGHNAWELEFHRKVSTNAEGIRKMLAGPRVDKHPTITEFQNTINARLSNAQA